VANCTNALRSASSEDEHGQGEDEEDDADVLGDLGGSEEQIGFHGRLL